MTREGVAVDAPGSPGGDGGRSLDVTGSEATREADAPGSPGGDGGRSSCDSGGSASAAPYLGGMVPSRVLGSTHSDTPGAQTRSRTRPRDRPKTTLSPGNTRDAQIPRLLNHPEFRDRLARLASQAPRLVAFARLRSPALRSSAWRAPHRSGSPRTPTLTQLHPKPSHGLSSRLGKKILGARWRVMTQAAACSYGHSVCRLVTVTFEAHFPLLCPGASS